MTTAMAELLERLDLEPIEINLFRANSPNEGWQRVYGGQVIGQALVAVSRTIEDTNRVAHSLHAYFLRPGAMDTPIVYQVDRIREGRSFTTRSVIAIQKGQPIFSMTASFQVQETGVQHQTDMPDVPGPEDCMTPDEYWAMISADAPDDYADLPQKDRPIEMRFVEPINEFKPEKSPPYSHVWIRTTEPMPEDIRLNQCMLAYASDMTLLDTSLRPHSVSWNDHSIQVASLDHAMWFHHPMQTDQWCLFAQESPVSAGARGFNRSLIYSSEGVLVASVAQEGLLRIKPTGSSK